MRMAALSLLLVFLLALAACGGTDESPSTGATTPSASAPAGSPTIAPPKGVPVPEALSRFRCDPDGAGTYRATGVVKNSSKARTTFHVTVFVGEATGATPTATSKAKTKELPSVAAGGSVDFTLETIPAAAEGGTCHVQVLTAE
ncbi:MAG: hypothetical protein JWR55_504 [Aeromicrobium sp.]|jgi:hypothetical protein|nr:hypothetical protein [Aeromicrobium sp.]